MFDWLFGVITPGTALLFAGVTATVVLPVVVYAPWITAESDQRSA